MTHRIVHVIPTLDRGGAEKQLTLLAAGLPRDRFDVHVCALTRGGPLAEPLRAAGIPVHVIGKRWKVDPAAYWRLRRLLCRLRPDLVHTWLFAANCYGRQAAMSVGVPHIVCGERCVDPWKAWYELALDRRLARRTDVVVTNSSGVVDFYARQGIPPDLFRVIPNGVEQHNAPEAVLDRAALSAQLRIPGEARFVGTVGRLWPQKGHKDLIWAEELLRVVRTDVHLLIVGDGPLLSRLIRWRDRVGVSDHVHFLGHREDVPRLLPLLSCFWLGSSYEGQSNSVMEAMCCGLPVVATDIPGNRDLVVDGQTGFLVPQGDHAAFVRATLGLLDNPSQARSFGEAGRRRMREEFTVQKMIDRHVALYDQVLAGS
ncbi:MAG: glycosyltransferase [Planctomycetes bacterium]|nr:glycosyltransferase [Planctomycetota bacterium]